MIKTRLKYCVYDPDRFGNDRYYIRKPGHKKVRIRETFEDGQGNITEAFFAAYRAALAAMDAVPLAKKEPLREDTFEWLVNQYYRSAKFQKLGKSTQREKRSVLDRYCETAGARPYKAMQKDDVEKSQAKRKDTPGAADNLVKVLRAMFNWAMHDVKPPLMTHNPAVGISKVNTESEGFYTWTPADVEQYREHYPLGTTARLALEIMLNIGARISDAAKLGPPHQTGVWLRFTAEKNKVRKPKRIEVKMLPELRKAIETTKIGTFTFLITDYGLPFTKAGLGGRMRDWCDAAGLPECTSHGLRKAAAVEHAENMSTAPEMCALFGWDKLETAEVYIRKAREKTMAGNAIERLEERRKSKSVPLFEDENASETITEENDGKSRPR